MNDATHAHGPLQGAHFLVIDLAGCKQEFIDSYTMNSVYKEFRV